MSQRQILESAAADKAPLKYCSQDPTKRKVAQASRLKGPSSCHTEGMAGQRTPPPHFLKPRKFVLGQPKYEFYTTAGISTLSCWHTALFLKLTTALSAAYSALQWYKISILVDPKQISVVQRSDKEKTNVLRPSTQWFSAPPPVMPLGFFDLLACTTFWGWRPCKHYLKGEGGCQ